MVVELAMMVELAMVLELAMMVELAVGEVDEEGMALEEVGAGEAATTREP
ncbi:predicted protein [Arabidopsis lyrata subsp. lyrata]|uniref:Predicted protein n=1 Tax=Arabidopsis lyrata subsp. lyrata TaxID=81972 RepID=D7MHJ6_ARALL|nr:predicted protein [Arabidopsis lyrata subsp. lyrata]